MQQHINTNLIDQLSLPLLFLLISIIYIIKRFVTSNPRVQRRIIEEVPDFNAFVEEMPPRIQHIIPMATTVSPTSQLEDELDDPLEQRGGSQMIAYSREINKIKNNIETATPKELYHICHQTIQAFNKLGHKDQRLLYDILIHLF